MMATKKHKRARTGEYDVNRSDVWAGAKYLGKVPIGTSFPEAKKRFPGATGVSSPACLGLRKGDTIDQLGRTRCAPKGGRKGGGGLAAFPLGGKPVRQGLAPFPLGGPFKPFKASSKKPARRRGADASKVQTLLFSKTTHKRGEKRWTEKSAKAWAKAHGYRYGDVDEKPNTYRLRQFEPNKAKWDYRTISFGKSGIKAVVAFPKRAAGHMPVRLRGIEGGSPSHVLREVEEQLLRRVA